ncbi:MAG: hypothetical protein EOP24_32005 [Hyphomicrobiales bacterium]|nr:MAG: hypothetical protein EOP24_32005 [Hyphomicrobiales bacterium]
MVRILSQGFQVGARDDGAWRFSTAATAPDWTDEDVDWMVDSGRIVAVHLAPRPEPVVAPLPSEAVERVRADMMTRASLAINGRVDAHRTPDLMRVVDALVAAGYRLVREDDEDTVRVLNRLRDWLDPTTDTYQPYVVDIGGDVILAVGVDDLRVLLGGEFGEAER